MYPDPDAVERLLTPFDGMCDDHRLLAVLRPDNGVGISQDLGYVAAFNLILDNGHLAAAYVDTNYGARSLVDVQHEIDTWLDWYRPNALFLDRANSDTLYYQTLAQYAKGRGIKHVTINTGTLIDPSRIPEDVDLMVIAESAKTPKFYKLAYWLHRTQSSKAAIISHSQPELPKDLSKYKDEVDWYFVTDATLPNPYESFPTYWEELVESITTTTTDDATPAEPNDEE